jgi:hypothetical protein
MEPGRDEDRSVLALGGGVDGAEVSRMGEEEARCEEAARDSGCTFS